MAVIIPSGYCQVTMTFSSGQVTDGYWQSIWGANIAGGLPDVCESFADAFLAGGWEQFLSEDSTLVMVSAITDTLREDWPVLIPGENPADMAPPNVSLLLHKNTGVRGRRGVGRAYWPQILRDQDIDGRGAIDGTRLGLFQSAANGFMSSLGGDGITPVVLQGDDGISAPISPPPDITVLTVDSVAATQRRRLRR